MNRYYSELLDEEIYKKVLDNGFEIYIFPKKDYTKKHGFFATEYGALYNEFKDGDEKYSMPLGIAHFLEHKIFENEDSNTFEEFAKLGADVNAFTNYFSTCYTFSTVENYSEVTKELLKLVQNPYLTDENVEKEKKIIIQELKMYDDHPTWKAYMNLLNSMYFNHPIRKDIGGTVESVTNTTKDQLISCYNKFYTPDRMLIFIIGDVDVLETFDIIENSLTDEFKNRKKSPDIILPVEPKEVKEKYYEEEVDVSIPIFYMGIKDRVFYQDPKKRLEKGLISKILTDMIFGKSSSFFEEHYESGLINNSFSSDFSYGRTFGYTGISSETDNPEKLFEKIKDEIRNKKREGLSEKDFERIRKKMIGRYLSSFNSTKYIANSFINYYMRGIELFDYLETLQLLTFKKVEKRFFKHFNMEYCSVSVIRKGEK